MGYRLNAAQLCLLAMWCCHKAAPQPLPSMRLGVPFTVHCSAANHVPMEEFARIGHHNVARESAAATGHVVPPLIAVDPIAGGGAGSTVTANIVLHSHRPSLGMPTCSTCFTTRRSSQCVWCCPSRRWRRPCRFCRM